MHKTSVIMSIDTEFSTHKEDIGIFGNISGNNYGLDRFVELLGKYNIKATFFVDVYSVKTEYQNRFIKICQKLAQAGHDLELHTHPNGMFDSKRGCMKEYSFNEQVEIIARGKEIFKDWFGIIPVAHRAGDWGADYNTLLALKYNGILIDCSLFYGWSNCRLNKQTLTKNQLIEQDGVLEIPATVFKCSGAGVFKPYRLFSTDGNSCNEIFYTMRKMNELDFKIITAVFHSFSFLKWNKNRTKYRPSWHKIKKFESFLKTVSEEKASEIITLKEVNEIYKNSPQLILGGKDKIVNTGVKFFAERLLDRLKR